jgi:large subunit ribosomal protein L24
MALLPKKNKVMIKGVGVVTKHEKSRRADEPGSIRKEERFITMSCVMPVCSSCKKPSRVNVKSLETNQTVRVCNRCKEIF